MLVRLTDIYLVDQRLVDRLGSLDWIGQHLGEAVPGDIGIHLPHGVESCRMVNFEGLHTDALVILSFVTFIICNPQPAVSDCVQISLHVTQEDRLQNFAFVRIEKLIFFPLLFVTFLLK